MVKEILQRLPVSLLILERADETFVPNLLMYTNDKGVQWHQRFSISRNNKNNNHNKVELSPPVGD